MYKPWEEILTKAAEDIKEYLHAMSLWPEPPDEYSKSYVLILVFRNRARIRHVLNLLETSAIPSNYDNYKNHLTSLWTEAESILESDVLKDTRQVKEVLSGEFIERIHNNYKGLMEVRHLAQDRDLTGDHEGASEELREAAHDFLLCFQELAYVNDELNLSTINTTDEYKQFQEKFKYVEETFHKYFGYFHTVKYLLVPIRQREYNINAWWFTQTPEKEKVQEEEITDDRIKKICNAYLSHSSKKEECSEGQNAIAYALGELAAKERMKVRSHILECRSCADIVTEINYTEAIVKEKESVEVEADEKIIKNILARLLPHPPVIRSIVDRVVFIRDYISKQVDLTALPAAASRPGEEVSIKRMLNLLNLTIHPDSKGIYTILPKSVDKESCDSPRQYAKLFEFIEKTAITWYGGFAIKDNRIVDKYKPCEIRRPMKLLMINKSEGYDSLIIGIAGYEDELKKGIKAAKDNNEKAVSKLKVIWINCLLK